MKPNTFKKITGILFCTPPVGGKPEAKYVFQKTRAGHGNMPGDKTQSMQCRLWVKGTTTYTAEQKKNRGRFALGVAAWHALQPAEKQQWRTNANKTRLNGFQLFMRVWCRTTAQPSHTIWDFGATTWDSNTTTWD
jgi:hypothetical protein